MKSKPTTKSAIDRRKEFLEKIAKAKSAIKNDEIPIENISVEKAQKYAESNIKSLKKYSRIFDNNNNND